MPGWATRKPLRTRLADVHNRMMHDSRVTSSQLGHLDPFVLCKTGGDNDVLVIHIAIRRHTKCIGHLNHVVRPSDVPAFYPTAFWGRGFYMTFGEITFGCAALDPRDKRLDLLL